MHLIIPRAHTIAPLAHRSLLLRFCMFAAVVRHQGCSYQTRPIMFAFGFRSLALETPPSNNIAFFCFGRVCLAAREVEEMPGPRRHVRARRALQGRVSLRVPLRDATCFVHVHLGIQIPGACGDFGLQTFSVLMGRFLANLFAGGRARSLSRFHPLKFFKLTKIHFQPHLLYNPLSKWELF